MRAQVREAGCFVISWSQTEIDGLSGAPIDALRRGASWRWRGESVCLDAATGFSGLLDAHAAQVMRRHAVSRARDVLGRALSAEGVRMPAISREQREAQTVTLTDGPRRWVASLIDMAELGRPFFLFLGDMPPADVDLRVTVAPARPEELCRLNEVREGVVCFAVGARLETPEGARAVEDIVAGDRVVTKDGGAREVLWVGVRHVSRARLMTTPDLRPVRIAAGSMGAQRPEGDLLVSPDHMMLLAGPETRAICGESEVLVPARSLVGRPGITRVSAAAPVTYYHLMLGEHGILVANGVETESFHPGAANLSAIASEQRARLFDLMPDLARSAANYGPPARRVLSRAEADHLARRA